MRLKISSKLILAVSGVTITIIAIFAYFIIQSQRRALVSQVEHNANQLSETVKSSTRYDMLLNQRDRVHRIIDTIGKQPGIEKIRIFNKEGEIIYSSQKIDIGSMVDKRAEACYACHAADKPIEKLSIPERTRIFEVGHEKNLGIINPIYNEPSCWQASCHAHHASQKVLGVLDVTMSLAEVQQQISANQMRMLFFAISAIVSIGIILWFLVQQLVGKPVSQMVKATNVVASGNLDYKIEVSNRDELGQLAQSFNEMTSKLAEAQRQLIQSDKLASLGRLAAGVAHEINNPLTGVLTYSSFLLKRNESNGEMKKDLEVIVRETKRCREIVKGLLDFARQVPARKTRCDLNQAIENSLSIVDNQLGLSHVTVVKNLQDNLPTIGADTNQMQQVLINLFVNGIDAMGKGGQMTVSTKALEKEGKKLIEIRVGDTGAGIPRENLTKIFEPFYTTKGQKGTGLGLAVVWGIIEKHGGTIDVQSEVGKGTTFILCLPVQESSAIIVEDNPS